MFPQTAGGMRSEKSSRRRRAPKKPHVGPTRPGGEGGAEGKGNEARMAIMWQKRQ